MLCDILVNIFSDIIFLVLGILIFWLYNLFTNRTKLLQFFGIEKSKRITIYISRLDVTQGGATGSDGKRYSYQGATIPFEESKSATYLQSLFNYFLPSQIDKPLILEKLLIADIEVNILVSPSDPPRDVTETSVISLGSPAYNQVSRYIQDSYSLIAKIEYSTKANLIQLESSKSASSHPPIPPSGVILPTTKSELDLSSDPATFDPPIPQIKIPDIAPYTDASIGFIQRLMDNKNKRIIFYIAGLSEHSTAGCANYLSRNWKKLYKKYGKDVPFLILLEVQGTNIKEILEK